MEAIIKFDDFKRLIKCTLKCVSKGDARVMLNYIQLKFIKETSTVEATSCDGYKLAMEKASCIVSEDFTAYIKPYLPTGLTEEEAFITLDDDICSVEIGRTILSHRQPKGDFVDVKKLISDYEKCPITCKVGVDRKYLLEVLKSLPKNTVDQNPFVIEVRQDIGMPVIFRTNNGLNAIMQIRLKP